MPGLVETQDLVVGRGWMIARYRGVDCAYFGSHVDDSSFDDYIEQLDGDIRKRSISERIGVLYYAENADMDSPRRRRMAQVLEEHKDKLAASTAAYALATSSPFIRGVLTTLFWLAPPGYPYKIVPSPMQGLDFIAGHMPGIDAEAIERSFTALLGEHMRKAG